MTTIEPGAQTIARQPLSPLDISLVERAFLKSISTLGLTIRDAEAVRLAALAIQLFQTGMHDEAQLRRAIMAAGSEESAN